MARFAVPAQPARSVLCVDRLLGVDMTNDPGNVAKEQSPCGDNMIRDVPGKVRKCMGYERLATLTGAVHGCHFFKEEALVHAGQALYRVGRDWQGKPELLCEGTGSFSSQTERNCGSTTVRRCSPPPTWPRCRCSPSPVPRRGAACSTSR